MERRNESRHQTAFTVSIEAKGDDRYFGSGPCPYRAHRDQPAMQRQGHYDTGPYLPLVARDGGTLVRAGHTEAVVDIARATGVADPSGVICEIMKDDGEMARLPDLIGFAKNMAWKSGRSPI